MLMRLTSWRPLAGLAALIFLLSAAMASTSMLVSGSAAAFLSAPGAAPNVVILSGGGSVPETGSINLSAVQNATKVPGVVGESPEVYAPVEVGGRLAIVRGVNLSEFTSVQTLAYVAGSPAQLGNATVLVGEVLARQAGLGVGSSLVMTGIFTNSTATVRVAAIVSAGAPYDAEILASLQLARSMRGLSPAQVTFERLRVDPGAFNRSLLLQAVGGNQPHPRPSAGNPVIQQLQLAPTASLISLLPAGSSAPTLASVLGRGVEVVQATFESLDAVVLLVSALAVYFATSSWLEAARRTDETLGALGMGKGREIAWHLAAAVPVALAAGLAGFAAASLGVEYLAGAGALAFFFQPLQAPFDPAALAASCGGPALAVAVSIVLREGFRGR